MVKQIFLSLGCIFLLAACVVKEAHRQPNVIIFLTDDQGTLDVNCFGAKDLQTPTMDKLAETGVRFTQAYSHTVCCPARALLLTGRHPQRSGITDWTQGQPAQVAGTNMPLSEYTLAEALKDKGYKTALFGKWHLGAKKGYGPINQGFDEFYGHLGGFIENYRHFFMHGSGFHDLYEQDKEIFREGNYFPEMATKKAIDFVERNKDQPFFMYVSFNIPHYPEQPAEKFKNSFANLPAPRSEYAKMIATVDDYMGQILQKVEDLQLRENTIILFYSDNGHSTEEASVKVNNHKSGFAKGYYYGTNKAGYAGKWAGHKGDLTEGGIRVPAILSFPGQIASGIVREQAVIGADWYPTILELCGVSLPKVKLDGRSVLPLIKDAKASSPHQVLYWAWQQRGAVRQDEWKLIFINNKATFLYNLNDEQPEQVNYLNDKPEIVKELTDLYRKWQLESSLRPD